MRILVAGAGGREHALAFSLSREGGHELHAAPGNPGMAGICRCHPVKASDIEGIVSLARELGADLVVPGPEAPLVAGLADSLSEAGIRVFGPCAAGAAIEGSKFFAKEIMLSAGVPTAEGRLCATPEEAMSATRGDWPGWVLKADGLASGKGVFLPGSDAEAAAAMDVLFPGGSGRVVVERRLTGREVSMMALCSGTRAFVLPPSRDHKRAFDGDTGPNTGGMGAVCPAPDTDAGLGEWTLEHIIVPVLEELTRRGIDYRGTLFAGLMLTSGGPSVLEFNCRFGDPETQAVMSLARGDTGAAFASCAAGSPDFSGITVDAGASACVVMASQGYPGAFRTGMPVTGIEAREMVEVFHAGTALADGRLVTAGGRVLGVTGTGRDLDEALARAYSAVEGISFEGAFWRRDIGRTI